MFNDDELLILKNFSYRECFVGDPSSDAIGLIVSVDTLGILEVLLFSVMDDRVDCNDCIDGEWRSVFSVKGSERSSVGDVVAEA